MLIKLVFKGSEKVLTHNSFKKQPYSSSCVSRNSRSKMSPAESAEILPEGPAFQHLSLMILIKGSFGVDGSRNEVRVSRRRMANHRVL